MSAVVDLILSVASSSCRWALRDERAGSAGPRANSADARERRSSVADKALLMKTGQEMLERSHATKQPLTVAVFELDDLPELETVFGKPVARQAAGRLAAMLRQIAGRTGLVARCTPTMFTLLLPGLDRDQALEAIHRVSGKSCCIEFTADGEDIVVVPQPVVHTVLPDSVSFRKVHHSLRLALLRARLREERRRNHLERERESHSRPMVLQATVPAALPKPLVQASQWSYAPVPATIPMGMR